MTTDTVAATEARRAADDTSRGAPPPHVAFLVCAGLMAILLAVGMAVAIPNYDDTLLRILEVESPPRALYESHGDQPLSGFLWWKLSELGILWPVGIAANTIGWLVIAFFTYRLYCLLSRNDLAPAVAASVLAVAPILTEIQFVVLSTGFLIVGSTALVCAAIYLCLFQGNRVGILSSALAAVLAFAGNLFYFYGVPAVAAGATLLCIRGIMSPDRASARRDFVRAAILVVAGTIGFGVYVKSADFSWRSGPEGAARVDAGQALRSAAYVVPRLPVLVSDGLWKGAGGALFREIGLITFKGKPAMLGAAVGLGLAVVMVLMVRRDRAKSPEPSAAQALPTPFDSVLATALVYCLPTTVVAMLPALFMGRPIRDEEMISRYAMTMVPFASCLTMALISACLSTRLVLPVAAFVVAIAADRAVSEAYDEHRQVEQFRAWGDQIAEHVDPNGYTVAFVTAPQFATDDTADDVLNARLTANWPLEKRLRFWATPAITSRGPHGTTVLRGLKRPDHVDRLLLVVLDEPGLTITQVPPEELKILAQPDGTDH